MTDREYFEFVYDEYKTELALADTLYQRAGILLTALALLGGAWVKVSRFDLTGAGSPALTVPLLQGFTVISALLLGVGVVYLLVATFPRDYPKVNKPYFWNQWRREYWEQLVEDDPDDEPRNRAALSRATNASLVERLSDAQAMAAYINQKRLRAFQRGVLLMGLAVPSLIVQFVLVTSLRVHGI